MDRNSVYKYPCTIYMNYTIKQEEEDRPKQRCCVRMYMFVVYLVLLILASIFVSILTPPIHGKVSRDGWSRRRYQWCSLGGTPEQLRLHNDGDSRGCNTIAYDPNPNDSVLYLQRHIFNSLVASVVLNSMLLIWLFLSWCEDFPPQMATCCCGLHRPIGRLVILLVNGGFFLGVAVRLSEIENVTTVHNMENNIYFEEFNPIVITIIGLVFLVIELLAIIIKWGYASRNGCCVISNGGVGLCCTVRDRNVQLTPLEKRKKLTPLERRKKEKRFRDIQRIIFNDVQGYPKY